MSKCKTLLLVLPNIYDIARGNAQGTGFFFLYVGHVWIEGVSNHLSKYWAWFCLIAANVGLCGTSVMELGGHWLKDQKSYHAPWCWTMLITMVLGNDKSK